MSQRTRPREVTRTRPRRSRGRKDSPLEESRVVTKYHTPAFKPRPTIMSQPTYTDVRLCYADQASYDASSSTAAYNCYRANGIFDPDVTGAGHQPMGYDQWSALYYCWVCPWVDVEMTVTPGSSEAQGLKFGLLWQTTPTIVSTNVVVLSELTYGKSAFFAPGSGTPITLRYRVDNARLFALDQLSYIEQGPNGFGGCTPQDPARGSYLFTWVGTTLSTQEPVAVNVNVKLTYGVRFSSPIPNTASLERQAAVIEKLPVKVITPTCPPKDEKVTEPNMVALRLGL